MRNDFESDYLAHHGILGQKWGVKNGPPYPLGVSNHSQSEKKAGWKKSLKDSYIGAMDKKAANRQSKADSYAQKYGKRSQVLDTKARIAKEEADKVRSVKQKKVADKQVENKNHLTDEQKRMIRNGAIAAGAALAVVGGMYLYKKGKLNPTHIAFFRYGKNMDLSNLSNEAFVISKTHKLQRVTNNSIEDYIGEGKSIYASFTKKDNHLYKEIMPKYINEWDAQGIIKGGNSAYVHSMKLKRDIKIAPDKVWVDAYMKVNDVDHVDLGEARKFMVNLVDRNNEINRISLVSAFICRISTVFPSAVQRQPSRFRIRLAA